MLNFCIVKSKKINSSVAYFPCEREGLSLNRPYDCWILVYLTKHINKCVTLCDCMLPYSIFPNLSIFFNGFHFFPILPSTTIGFCWSVFLSQLPFFQISSHYYFFISSLSSFFIVFLEPLPIFRAHYSPVFHFGHVITLQCATCFLFSVAPWFVSPNDHFVPSLVKFCIFFH